MGICKDLPQAPGVENIEVFC